MPTRPGLAPRIPTAAPRAGCTRTQIRLLLPSAQHRVSPDPVARDGAWLTSSPSCSPAGAAAPALGPGLALLQARRRFPSRWLAGPRPDRYRGDWALLRHSRRELHRVAVVTD